MLEKTSAIGKSHQHCKTQESSVEGIRVFLIYTRSRHHPWRLAKHRQEPHYRRLISSYFRRPTRPNLNSHCFISTRRPRKRTPSASSRSLCSIAESPRSLISPPEPRTRCHGKPKPRR